MMNRPRGNINQAVLEHSFDRLVRASPIPQVLCSSISDRHYFPHSKQGHKTSHSVRSIPRQQFIDPFRSPPAHYSRVNYDDANQSIVDIFKSLKTSTNKASLSKYDNNYCVKEVEDEEEEETDHNENAAAQCVANIAYKPSKSRDSFTLNKENEISRSNNNNLYCEDSNINSERNLKDDAYVLSKTHNAPVSLGQKEADTRQQFVNANQETYSEAFGIQDTEEVNDDDQAEDIDTTDLEDAQVLHYWIIKQIPECNAICIEGKKSVSEEEYWHTGVVTQRLSSKVVATQSGSIYRLVGNMELFDALAEGFSSKMCEAFWLGFPEDWETLVQKHFSAQPTDTNTAVISTSTSTAHLRKEAAKPKGNKDISLLHVEEVEEEVVTDENMETTAEDSQSFDDSEDLTLTEVDYGGTPDQTDGVQLPNNGKTSQKREITLSNWIIRNIEGTLGVYVIGNKENGMLWHSNEIEKRITNRKLQTISGSVYILKGNINNLLALDSDLPDGIIKKFRYGFPKDWQELIQENFGPHIVETHNYHVSPKKRRKSTKDKQTKLQKRKEKSPQMKPSTSNKKKDQDNRRQSEHKKEKKSASKGDRRESEQKNEKGCSTPDVFNRSVILANGQMANLDSLGRSRSGRLVKPPMQWWTGQHLCTEGDKVIVTTRTAYASEYLRGIEEGYRRSKTKIKSYYNPVSGNKDSSLASSRSSVYDSDASVPSMAENERTHDNKSKAKNKRSERESNKSCDKIVEIIADSDINLEKEVTVVLHKMKQNRGRNVKTHRETCYNGKQESVQKSQEQVYDLDETAEEEESETVKTSENRLSTVRRSSRRSTDKSVNEKLEQTDRRSDRRRSRDSKKEGGDKHLDQENIVSSSTGTLDDDLQDFRIERHIRSCRQKVAKIEEVGSAAPRTRSRKRLSVIESDTETDDEKKTKRDRRANRRSRKDSVVIEDREAVELNNGENEDWTEEEKRKLSEACGSLDPSHPHYWEHVARKVGSKSSESCKQEAFHSHDTNQSSAKTTRKKDKPKATALTANVGTLKRRTQLREILEQHDKSYSDDLFGSTPFRNRRKRKMDIEDTVFGEFATKNGRKFVTPVAPGVKGSRINVKFASAKKTPSVNNKDKSIHESTEEVERYAHKIQKRQMAGQRLRRKSLAGPKVSNTDESPQKNLFNVSIKENEQVEEEEGDADSEQEPDYYWNDC